ncbi:MAG: DUF1592 domain-containing protein [Verrucomicrobiales bacterium]|nr:DUF1592 domain-containing protein [Verrucomicrobiales bacterium]
MFATQQLKFPILGFTVFCAANFCRADDAVRNNLESFLENHCYECHDDLTAEGDLDLMSVGFDLKNPSDFAAWDHVYERVKNGEMPPEKKPRPETAEVADFLATIRKPLLATDRAYVKEFGRVHGRRLTRDQYEQTLHDMLGIDIPLARLLPADDAGHEFETVAENQQLSHFHLDKYLLAANEALSEAFERARRGDKSFRKTYRAKELTRKTPGNYRGPEARDGKTIAWRINLQFSGRMPATTVPESGWYRITVKNFKGINRGKDGAVWGSIRSGACYSNEPILHYVGSIEAIDKARTQSFDAWMEEGHMLELEPNEGTDRPAPTGATGGNVSFKGRNLAKDGFAGISFESITMERIYPYASAGEVRKILYPGVKFEKGKPVIDDKKAAIRKLVARFAERAFRRPVTDDLVKPYADLALAKWEKSKSFETSLQVGYRAVLCSPRFLGFVEPPGQLDGYALASRLSYFLWNSLPDEELLKLAKNGQLGKSEVLQKQVDRMLADQKSNRFVESFTDQWLNLKEIDFTTPDPRRFKEFDPVLQESMVDETRAFIRELIQSDLSARNLISSDFAMLNSRLSTHYGQMDVDIIPGKGLQKVTLPETARGGLVTQGSVLKVTADGSVTSPILRGVWVNERILGLETPPPPPNVPAVEPDIRGATSIRDQLAKHSSDESCASCHAKIDPAGFALENFDPVGKWRRAYGTSKKSAKVDPSGVTPDGKKFAGISQWKNIYAGRPEMLAESFVKQLLSYGTGAEIRFSDEPVVEEIVASAKGSDYGLRSLLRASIDSPIFRMK